MLVRKSAPPWTLYEKGDIVGALNAFRRAKHEPPHTTLRLGAPGHGIGSCLVALGQRAEAEAHLREAQDVYTALLRKSRADDDLLFLSACVKALLGDQRGVLA